MRHREKPLVKATPGQAASDTCYTPIIDPILMASKENETADTVCR